MLHAINDRINAIADKGHRPKTLIVYSPIRNSLEFTTFAIMKRRRLRFDAELEPKNAGDTEDQIVDIIISQYLQQVEKL